MGYSIEEGIRPLVDAVNKLDFANTIYSCEGHFDGVQKEKFLPTAYVTFSVNAVQEFSRLYESLLALGRSLRPSGLRLTYDCLLGRYTLSIWPEASLREPSQKRAVVDSVVKKLSETILNREGHSSTESVREECAGSSDGFPCDEPVLPCTLVIPPEHPTCPFKGSTGKG